MFQEPVGYTARQLIRYKISFSWNMIDFKNVVILYIKVY